MMGQRTIGMGFVLSLKVKQKYLYERSAMLRRLRLFAAFFIISLQAFVGCTLSTQQMDRADNTQATGLPSWAEKISEPLELIPQKIRSDRWEVASPSVATTNSVDIPRGMPRDLTQSIQASTKASLHHSVTPNQASQRGRTVPANTDLQKVLQTIKSEGKLQHASSGRLERLYQGRFEREADRRMTQFGYDYFERQVDPDSQGPVSNDYLLGPGDEIVVTVSGSFEDYQRVEINRDGQLVIPTLEPIAVANRTFADLKTLVQQAYSQFRQGFQLNVSMGRLRKIRVHVVGQVGQPGLVQVSAHATLLDALAASGGPTKTGSLRKIQLRRDQEPVRHIDLYQFFVDGEKPRSVILQAGDVIHVPPIGQTIAVAGYVQRPGIYEIIKQVSIESALELAGGFTPFTFTPRVQLERTVDGRGRETLDITLNTQTKKQLMGDGELLLIGAVDDRLQPVVRISGEVVRPGNYQYRQGLRIRDLIVLADGLTIDAYLPQAFISRQVGEAAAVEIVIDRKNLGLSRRVLVVNLSKAIQGDQKHDRLLLPLDHITIRSRAQSTVRPVVEIMGAVKHAGRFELTANLRVSELIALAGNVLPNVYYDEAELIRRIHNEKTGELDVKRYRFNLRRALEQGGKHDPILENGDRLIIRRMHQAEIKARIQGQVRFPGEYVFPAGTKISQLIAAAGGLIDDADMRAAKFFRQSVQQLQKKRMHHLSERTQRLFEDALREMVQTGAPREGVAAKLALKDIEETMDRMRGSENTGRIVIPFTRSDFPNSPYNLVLEQGDHLVIPRRQETVTVIGCVFTPNSFVAAEGITVDKALNRVGGVTDLADDKQVYVIRADGIVESMVQRGKKRLAMTTVLLPGDVVLVPRRTPQRTFGAQATDVLAFLRQAAELSITGSQIGQPIAGLALKPAPSLTNQGSGVTGYQDTILENSRR